MASGCSALSGSTGSGSRRRGPGWSPRALARRGIGSALLDAAVTLCRERGDRQPLVVVPRHSIAGKRLALSRGGTLDHSEHHLVLSGEPTSGPHKPEISLRPATVADVPLVVSLLEQGFRWSRPDDLVDRLERTALIELRGVVVGTLFLERDDDEEASIFGFAVEPSSQGRGIGRPALRQACDQLRADGARRISLDVDVANDRALGSTRRSASRPSPQRITSRCR